MPARAVIVGIGRTAYSRESGRSTLALAAEAARAALADAGLAGRDVNGAATYQIGDSAAPMQVAHAIGSPGLDWNIDLMGGGNYATSVVANAALAIEAGACDVALAYRALNGRSGHRFGRADGALRVGGERQFAAPHGYLTPPQWMAMWTREHQRKYSSTCEDLGRIAVTQRAHAAANPHALQRRRITLDDYFAGRVINEPLRIYDCALEVDGAVALVLTTRARARDLRQKPVALLGHAEFTGQGGSWDQWPDLASMYSAHAGPALWRRTGLSPADVDVACMYDCFTTTVMVTLEEFGLCERGAVGRFFAEGRATYGGDLVVNPHGGLLSEGYIHGLNHAFEAVLQLRGQAGDRQVADARVALVTAGAGPYGGGMLLAEAPV
jgi:acetyl-CoA acetyltransferase